MKIKVLLICNMGNTRSRYLAKYLKEKGYNTKWGGVSRRAIVKLTQKKLDWADKIVVVDSIVKRKLHTRFKVPKKEVIEINVSDALKDYPRSGFIKKYDALKEKFLKSEVYPRLRKQIDMKLK